jgi:hypothetical protein
VPVAEKYTDKKSWRFLRQLFCAIIKRGNNRILLVALEVGFFRFEKFIAHVFGFVDS